MLRRRGASRGKHIQSLCCNDASAVTFIQHHSNCGSSVPIDYFAWRKKR
jgi:hypothetical protein